MKIELRPIGGGGWSLRYTALDGREETKLFTNWARAKAAVRKILNGVDPEKQ
jgi:hypothetical protein